MRKKLRRRLVDEEIGEEVFMPTSSIPIPIVVSVVILFMYVGKFVLASTIRFFTILHFTLLSEISTGVGAICFHAWEKWDVTTAAYFSFITLTTIGFGDYSPTQTFEAVAEPDAGSKEYIALFFSTLYCAIGK